MPTEDSGDKGGKISDAGVISDLTAYLAAKLTSDDQPGKGVFSDTSLLSICIRSSRALLPFYADNCSLCLFTSRCICMTEYRQSYVHPVKDPHKVTEA